MVKSGLYEKNYDILDKISTLTKGANNTYKDAIYSFVVYVKNIKPADTKALENYINYKPNTNIKHGIKAFVDWYKNYNKL